MIVIKCENCDTQFRVPAQALGASGRFVKCTKCQHEWLAKPETATPVENVDAEEHKVSKPYKKFIPPPKKFYEEKPFKYASYMLTIISTCFLGWVLLVSNHYNITKSMPFVQSIYNLFSHYDHQALKIMGFDWEVKDSTGKTGLPVKEIEFDIYLKNTAVVAKTMDKVRVGVYNDNFEELGNVIVDKDYVVEPGQVQLIDGWLNSVPKDARYISVDIGNSSEIMMRDLADLKDRILDPFGVERAEKAKAAGSTEKAAANAENQTEGKAVAGEGAKVEPDPVAVDHNTREE
jgi:predicted Zn finger-like uncharacterized protein